MNGITKQTMRTNTMQRWYIHKHPTRLGKKQSNTTKNAIASKHQTPGLPSPPTAIWRNADINDKEQQTMEPVKMDFSMTA